MKKLEINNNFISVNLSLKCGNIGHSCLIYKGIDNKYYFDNSYTVIKIDYKDLKNKKFQKNNGYMEK